MWRLFVKINVGPNANLVFCRLAQMPKVQYRSNCKPSTFAYPPALEVPKEKEKEKVRAEAPPLFFFMLLYSLLHNLMEGHSLVLLPECVSSCCVTSLLSVCLCQVSTAVLSITAKAKKKEKEKKEKEEEKMEVVSI